MSEINDIEPNNPSPIVEGDSHRDFVLNCLKYFCKTPMWARIEPYCEIKRKDKPVKVYKKEAFNLPGMFLYGDSDIVKRRNSVSSQRWQTVPFEVKGKQLFVTTQWVSGEEGSDKSTNLTIIEFGKLIKSCFGKQYNIVKTGVHSWALYEGQTPEFELKTSDNTNTNMETSESKFSVKRVIENIDNTGLIYAPLLIKRFVFSLLSKRFLILSGLAGSGKTQLALAFAKMMVADDSQMCVVSVGADWTNREPLLGFPNALKPNEYVKPESGVLDLLLKAKEDDTHPYFLILDEMNMSYVERYFADFLSSMESHEPIKLWTGKKEDIPQEVPLSDNVFIGTINVDETTYMFSPKVLDRANVIEFKVSEKEMDDFLDDFSPINMDILCHKGANMAEDFVSVAKQKDIEHDKEIKEILINFFKNLKEVNAEFGYRSAMEIYRYIHQAKTYDDSDEHISKDEIIDSVIVQKLLPKLHGSRKKLEPVLNALWQLCFVKEILKDVLTISRANAGKAKLPLTADKIARMMEAAYANGFTSFAEA